MIEPDNIPNWLLRNLPHVLAPSICQIFNTTTREGLLPDLWKSDNIVPILKANFPRFIKEDLSPISLIAGLSKELKGIVGGWMFEIISDKRDRCQFGGFRGSSTIHALVKMVHTWLVSAEGKKDHMSFLTSRKPSIMWTTLS